MLRYLCRRVFKGLPLKKFRQRGRIPGFPLRVAAKRRSISFHPAERTVFLLAANSSPAQEKTAVTASKVYGTAAAIHRRVPARVRIFRSLSGSAERSVLESSFVGMIAWWSDTFLLFRSFPISGEKSMPDRKGSFSLKQLPCPPLFLPCRQ